MGIIKNIFLALFALLLIFDLTLYVMLAGVKDNVLSAQFYTGILERNNGYTKIQSVLIDSISKGGQNLPPGFTQEDMKAVIQQSITPQWMKNQTERLIGNMIKYMTTDAVKPDLTISIVEVKTKLVASFVNMSIKAMNASTLTQSVNQSAMADLFNISVPGKCTGQECIAYCTANPLDCVGVAIPSELQNLVGKCGGPEECATYCQNPANAADCSAFAAIQSTPEIQAMIAEQVESQLSSQIPDTLDLYQTLFSDPQSKVQLSNAKTLFKQASFVLTIMLVIAIVIAILMAVIIGIGNLKGICMGIGIPLLTSGAGLAITALFIPGMAVNGIPSEVWKSMGTANAAFLQNVVIDTLRSLFSSVMANGLIIAGIGLVLVIASFFLKPPEPKEAKKKK